MTRSIRRGFLTCAITVGLTVAAAGTAAAQGYADVDQRSDVNAVDPGTGDLTSRPEIANGDVVRTSLRHGLSRIAVRVKFAELRRVGAYRSDGIRIVTDEGLRRQVILYAGQGMWYGEAMMTRNNGSYVECEITHRIDYDRDVVTASFPRTCLSNPHWVRLGVGSAWVSDSEEEFYADDALLDGRLNLNTVRLSPRLSRG